ncbi:disintegrin and metalloproteinase domain-containing protein 20 [Haliaeetus albicilla]|uniref:disintegrin and metalloproteinase domain-containing protein 20 n=1 Tax=Haliaeetus albicilla TaxID=8969 RepID=UPI0037E78337
MEKSRVGADECRVMHVEKDKLTRTNELEIRCYHSQKGTKTTMGWTGLEGRRDGDGGLATPEGPMGVGNPSLPGVINALFSLNAEFLTGFTEASRIIYSEVTVPRRLEAKDGTFTEGYTSYLITAEGNHHIVHLTRAKNLIAKDIPVFTYSPEGDLITEFPYIQDDCYYKGFVEGSLGSIVSLSTCFGISGVLQIGDLRYEIEPVENSSTFQHLIYRRALEGGSRQLCQVPEEHKDHLPEYGELANRSHKILVIEEVPGLQMLPVPTRYLELALVTNKELFKVKNYNETLMLHLFISISNLLNTVYRRMKLQIVISAVEMWTRTDQVTAARSLARTLQVFAAWCQRDAVGRMNYDHIQLLLGQHYKERGFAWKGTMCQTDSMGVVSFPGHDTISDMMMLAHEIGHSLGFSHDDAKQFQNKFCNCNCTQRGCIMRTSPGSCLAFSNCTMGEYYDEVIRKNLPCLLNIPSLKPFLLELCGNGVLEKEEECDCGSDEACLQEGCCFSSSCLLTPGASCYRGECCHKCQFQPAGKICREDRSICDLPEYCNGSSGSCPMDVFKQDGTLCGDNNRCYDGHCHSHEAQCKALFGRAAHRAPLSCFREVNVRGDRCGNCGWNGTYYTKCLEENVLCGRVQCANIKRVPVRQDGETVVQTTMNDQLCWGLEFHLAPDTPDEGSVKDGTSCGRNKICMNRTCVNAAFLNSDCREKKCNGRGVCNNKKNCHCDFGWAPPDCKLEGFGGSVDSGPPPPSHMLRVARIMGKAAGMLLLLFSILAFLLHKRVAIAQWIQRWRLRRQEKSCSTTPPPPKEENLAEEEESPSKD